METMEPWQIALACTIGAAVFFFVGAMLGHASAEAKALREQLEKRDKDED